MHTYILNMCVRLRNLSLRLESDNHRIGCLKAGEALESKFLRIHLICIHIYIHTYTHVHIHIIIGSGV